MTLQNRLVGLLTSFIVLPMLVSLAVGYLALQNRLEGFVVERLVGVNKQKVAVIESFFADAQKDVASLVSSSVLQPVYQEINRTGYDAKNPSYQAAVKKLDDVLTPLRLRSNYVDIKYVLDDKRDQVVYVNNPDFIRELGQEEDENLDPVVKEAGAGRAMSEIFVLSGTTPARYAMHVAANITDQDKLTIGVIVITLDLTPIYTEVTNASGLSASGESFILKDDTYSALYLTPLKYDSSAALNRRSNYGDDQAVISEKAVRGQVGTGRGQDYRGIDVLAAWAPVSGLPWAVETKIDQAEALSVAKDLRLLAIIATVAILMAVIGIVWVTILRFVERPLRSLQRAAEELSNGHYDVKVDDSMLYQSDEFGKLATFLHHISHRLKYEASGRKDQHQTSNEHPPHANHLHQ